MARRRKQTMTSNNEQNNSALTEALLQDHKEEEAESKVAQPTNDNDIQVLLPPSDNNNDDDEEQQQQQLVEEARVTETSWTKGEKQPVQYRDVIWSIIFIIHVIAVVVIAVVWGIPSLNYNPFDTDKKKNNNNSGDVDDDDSANNDDYTLHFVGVLYMCLLGGLSSIIISTLMLGVMIRHSQLLVQIGVLFTCATSLLLVFVFAFSNVIGGAIVSFIFFVFSCCYAYSVWHRIPFAASNLKVSTNAIQTNIGIMIIATILIIISIIWTCVWSLSILGVYVQTSKCDDQTGQCETKINTYIIIVFLLSYYWTQQVIKNVIHCTVAGVVGTWWFEPSEASSICSKSIFDSFVRSISTSFGSICLGSLLVALLQTLHQIVRNARRDNNRRGDNILLCLLECIVSLLESMLEYFNKYAYVYVGLYGYNYMEAGKNVTTLFKQRGWTTIINDNLVQNVLSLITFVTSIINGVIGISIAAAIPSLLSVFGTDTPFGIAFALSFLISFVITSILMSVIASAVDTVIVCFCEASNEFQVNHPLLHTEMIEAWQQVYPNEFVA